MLPFVHILVFVESFFHLLVQVFLSLLLKWTYLILIRLDKRVSLRVLGYWVGPQSVNLEIQVLSNIQLVQLKELISGSLFFWRLVENRSV